MYRKIKLEIKNTKNDEKERGGERQEKTQRKNEDGREGERKKK